jgi:hypothetical protein
MVHCGKSLAYIIIIMLFLLTTHMFHLFVVINYVSYQTSFNNGRSYGALRDRVKLRCFQVLQQHTVPYNYLFLSFQISSSCQWKQICEHTRDTILLSHSTLQDNVLVKLFNELTRHQHHSRKQTPATSTLGFRAHTPLPLHLARLRCHLGGRNWYQSNTLGSVCVSEAHHIPRDAVDTSPWTL